jgi:hypothetical protein
MKPGAIRVQKPEQRSSDKGLEERRFWLRLVRLAFPGQEGPVSAAGSIGGMSLC